MPELPEVESLRRSLEPLVEGRKIEDVEVKEPKIVAGKGQGREPSPEVAQYFENFVRGERIEKLQRCGKQIILVFASDARLLIHLKMTGQLVYTDQNHPQPVWGGHPIELTEAEVPHKHSHIIFHLDMGTLVYNDVRKFGYVLLYETPSSFKEEEHFKGMGKEPLDDTFTTDYFCSKLQETGRSLKSALMDDDIVAGLGNIYVDETAFRARIDPRRKANSLSQKECETLYRTIRAVIKRAIELGGSSVANYILADGSRGTYAREHQVYNRAGDPCYVCGNELEKVLITNRTTVFCPSCQK